MFEGNAPQINNGQTPMDLLLDIPLQLSVELGRRRMPVSEVLQLGPGSIVELSKAAGEALDIYVNDRLVPIGIINRPFIQPREYHSLSTGTSEVFQEP
jgi:flagellar motor switch protein FliN